MFSIATLRDFYAGQAATLAVDLPFVMIFLILISLIGGALVFVPIVLLAILLAIVYFLGGVLADALQTHTETDKRRHDFLTETLPRHSYIKSPRYGAFDGSAS